MMDKKEIHSIWSAFLEVQENKKKKLDPVGKADGDIDNDGDEDASDEYLANRRKKVGAAMKKEGKIPPQFAKKGDDKEDDSDDEEKSDKKKPEKGVNPFAKKGDKKDDKKDDKKEVEEGCDKKHVKEEECPKCEGEGCDHCDGKGYHEAEKESYGKKVKESNLFSDEELAALEEKAKGEEFMSTSSPKEKKVMADHRAGSDKKYEDWEDTSAEDASKAGKAVKSQSPVRRGESRKSEPLSKVKS